MLETVVLKRKYIGAAAAGLCLTVGICIFFILRYGAVYVYPQSKEIEINGKKHDLKNEAFIYSGSDYLSGGEIFPLLGYDIKWNNDTETLYVEKDGNTAGIKAGSNVCEMGEKTVKFSKPSKMYDERIYLNVKMLKKITGKDFKIKEKIIKKVTDNAVFYADKTEFKFNGGKKQVNDVPTKINGKIMIPAAAVLSQCGYTVTENDDTVTAERFGIKTEISEKQVKVNGKKYPSSVYKYHDMLFISIETFTDISEINAVTEGDIRESSFNKRDCLENTEQTDKYRKKEYFGTYNGVTIADGVGMELLGISEKSAEKYADVINKIADTLNDVTVYNIIVPSAGEFYSPSDMKVSQINGIKKAYERLNKNVIPINAYAALEEKADEYIFFKTDHHWTQRGAYYAYREFANQKGMYIPPLSEFKTEKTYGYLGSFEAFTAGTPGAVLLAASPDEFEKFYPNVNAKCTFYADCEMKNETGTGEVVSDYHSYTSFIGGDHPVTKIETDAKNGKKLVIIKESYGNAFATWAVNNYETIYAIDPREFNGFGGKTQTFNLKKFYAQTKFDDLIVITYPVSTISEGIRNSVVKMTE